MDREGFKKIIEDTDSLIHELKIDYKMEGLKIVSKYTEQVMHGASHDELYLEDINVLVKNGITKEDVIKLAEYNFGYDEDGECLMVFV